MLTNDVLVIRELPLFSTMNAKSFDKLLHMARLEFVPAEVKYVNEGDPADFLHVLMEGAVELFGSSNELEATVFVHRPISIFHLSAVLEDSTYLLSGRTLKPSRIMMIPAKDVQKIMKNDHEFAHALVTELTKRYRMAVKTFKELRLRTGLERLANYLLHENSQASKSGQIELTENKRKLASRLCITPEYLSRSFNTLKQHGVEVQGKTIYLKNLDALTHLAQPNPLIDRRGR